MKRKAKRPKFQRERLLEMCDFLEKLPPSKFDFNVTVDARPRVKGLVDYSRIVEKRTPEEISCGLVGCVGGHLPHVFPELVKYTDMILGHLDPTCKIVATGGLGLRCAKTGETLNYAEATAKVFGLPYHMADALFQPETAYDAISGALPCVDADAKPKAVAKMLRIFVKLVDTGEIDFETHPYGWQIEPLE